MATDNSSNIGDNTQAPQEVTTGAGTVRQVPIPDQIAGDRYANSRQGVKGKYRGLRFSKLIPSGPQSDQQETNPSSSGDFSTGNQV